MEINIKATELIGTGELSAAPWVKLEELERFLIGSNLIRLDGGNAFVELSRWITACGFSGVEFLGKPVTAHTDEATGPLGVIPTVYFRKERGSYGNIISRLSMEQTKEEWDAAALDDERGFGESDWSEVLVGREGLIAYIAKSGWHIEPMKTGGPGRPTSMQLVRLEFDRRVKSQEIHPVKAKEARYLADWVVRRFPMQPPLTAKTISNKITEEYRAATGRKPPGQRLS